MARGYPALADRAVLFEDEPIGKRTFQLILIEPNRVKHDATHETIEDILEADGGEEEDHPRERVALRTQVINYPNQPVNLGNKIVQLFAVNPNQDALVTRRFGAILTEIVGTAEVSEKAPRKTARKAARKSTAKSDREEREEEGLHPSPAETGSAPATPDMIAEVQEPPSAATGEETPLAYLNADEVWELAHGGGFAMDFALEAMTEA